jgi:hypothetical protein
VITSCREGTYTWLGLSSYGAVLEQKLASVLTSGPEGGLGTRAGLERLKQEPANAAGFQTLAGLATNPAFAGKGLDAVLATLGQSQIPIVARGQGLAAGPSGRVQLHVPAQLFRDIALAAASQKR